MASELEEEVGEFFDIESDLRERAEQGVATPHVADADSGFVVAAERRDLSAAPDDYPVRFTGDRVLALELKIDHDTQTTVFLDWPDEENDFEQIETLFEATGVSFNSFADIYGEDVPLEVTDGYVVVSGVDTSHTRVTNDDWETESDKEQDEDDPEPTPRLGSLFVFTGPWLWAAYEQLVGNGLTLFGWAGWLVVAILILFLTWGDRRWIREKTNQRLSSGWSWAMVLCPPVAVPVYALRRHFALQE